jgi:hypothetical protein
MAPSNYRDGTNTATDGKGDFKDIGLFMQIPVYMKTNELDQVTAWAIALSGTYASMNNTNLSDDQCLSQLLNSTLGVAHMRPLNEKWTLTASLGAGIYTDLSQFSADSIMVQAGALFIRRILPNLDLGFGVALNNVLGYPMLFPSVYLDWRTGERFQFKISLYDTLLASAGMGAGLFPYLHGFGGRDFRQGNKLREKWMNMSNEERKAFIEKEKDFRHFFHDRFSQHHGSSENGKSAGDTSPQEDTHPKGDSNE